MSVLTSIYIYIFLFYFQFSYNFFYIHLFFKYLHFLQLFLFPYFFISSLPSTLILLFIFPSSSFICLFLYLPSYYKLVTLFHSLHSFLSQKGFLSLSLKMFWWIFYFLLHLHFRLINFCVFKNSNLG